MSFLSKKHIHVHTLTLSIYPSNLLLFVVFFYTHPYIKTSHKVDILFNVSNAILLGIEYKI